MFPFFLIGYSMLFLYGFIFADIAVFVHKRQFRFPLFEITGCGAITLVSTFIEEWLLGSHTWLCLMWPVHNTLLQTQPCLSMLPYGTWRCLAWDISEHPQISIQISPREEPVTVKIEPSSVECSIPIYIRPQDLVIKYSLTLIWSLTRGHTTHICI